MPYRSTRFRGCLASYAALVISVALSCQAGLAPGSVGSVTGLVSLEGDDTHAGVLLYADGTHCVAFSDENGAYTLEDVHPGDRVVRAFKDGYVSPEPLALLVTAGIVTEAPAMTLFRESASAPVISPSGGVYESDVTVKVFSPTPGATVWLTSDGTAPAGGAGTPFADESLVVTSDGITVVQALCTKPGMADSETSVARLEISRPWIAYRNVGGGAGQFTRPTGCALDAQGRLYVADHSNGRIVRMDDMSGSGWTAYGTFGSGTGEFSGSASVAFDSRGRLYIADSGNDRVVRIDDMTGAGWISYGTSGTSTGNFDNPLTVALDAQDRILIADASNDRIVRIDDMSGTGWTVYNDTGQLYAPNGVSSAADGTIYIADTGNARVIRMTDMTGAGFSAFGSSGSGEGQFNQPRRIESGPDGRVYVSDSGNDRVVRLDRWASGWTTFGRFGSGDGQFNEPFGLCLDARGRVFVVDAFNCRVVRFTPPVF